MSRMLSIRSDLLDDEEPLKLSPVTIVTVALAFSLSLFLRTTGKSWLKDMKQSPYPALLEELNNLWLNNQLK